MPDATPHSIRRLTVLIPVCDDWEAAGMLLGGLRESLGGMLAKLHIVIVDDASVEERAADFGADVKLEACAVSVLTLRRNLGHQRALAVGLAWVAENEKDADAVVVMDSDGEDSPADVPKLIERAVATEGKAIVFAERTRRTENLVFRACYFVYRMLHLLLTGRGIRFGNFSVIPAGLMRRVASISQIWNHYAAAVSKAGVPISLVPTVRARRLTGESKMNFTGLVVHGLSAISVYGETIGVRLLIATGTCLLLVVGAGIAVLGMKFSVNVAVSGWATTVVGLLVIIFIQMAALSLQFVFLVLQSRSGASFIPSRDYGHFVESFERDV